jgi:SAM-dependent methyltransferase
LAERLKRRADAVTGLDASAAALDIARVRTPEIRWMCGAVPADLPDEKFDLIVLSEVAYFLDGPDLLSTLRAVRGALLPEGEIVLANWRHPTENIPLDGPTAHRQAATMMGLPRRAYYEDADLLIEVWGDPVSLHEASRRRS